MKSTGRATILCGHWKTTTALHDHIRSELYHLVLAACEMATVDDSQPTDLRMDGFRISLTYGWHKIVEGMNRLKNGE
jgi:hypothetical protein